LPPREKLSRFHQEGGDLVIFSGGKGIRGPQSTGIVVGRSDLIEACLLNSNPNSSVGRGMKVGKEEVAGFVRAVELFLERDEPALFAEWERRARVVADRLVGIPGFRARVFIGDHRGRPPEEPRCYVELLDPSLGTPAEVVDRIAKATPSVRVRVLADGFFASTMTLEEGEEEIVAERVAAALRH
jgi:L-seryl-tRNA(Ser) seleniumtransferase